MPGRERETESFTSRGSTSWPDRVYPFSGGGLNDGGQPETQNPGNGTGSSAGGGEGTFRQTSWFAPVEDDTFSDVVGLDECKDGICPVPWAKAVDLLGNSEFLTQDRNSNFPGENTIEFTHQGPPVIQEDLVNHPSHYTDGGIECIEAIEAALTIEEFRGYCKANCMKYIWRERHKGGTESLKKAQWYLNRLIELSDA